MFSGESPSNLFDLSPSNLAWVEDLYYAYRRDPGSVDETWRKEFERLDGGAHPAPNGGGNGHAVAEAAVEDDGSRVVPRGNGHGPAAPERHPTEIARVGRTGAAAAEIAAVAAQRALGGEWVRRLIEAYRELGHLAAELDPLG